MRCILVTVIAALSVAAAVPARAADDLEKFQKRLGKSAVDGGGWPENPKATCVCQEGVLAGYAGALRQTFDGIRVAVDCLVPQFDASHAQVGYTNCFQYVVLPK